MLQKFSENSLEMPSLAVFDRNNKFSRNKNEKHTHTHLDVQSMPDNANAIHGTNDFQCVSTNLTRNKSKCKWDSEQFMTNIGKVNIFLLLIYIEKSRWNIFKSVC